MTKALRFSLDQEALHPAYGALAHHLSQVSETSDIQLRIANSLWPQREYPFLPGYSDLIDEHYDVSITPVDYKGDPAAARVMINRWVEDRTVKKIQDVIQEGVLDADTRLVLANAIYFKGNWKNQFASNHTENAAFRVLPQYSVQTPMMEQKQVVGYAETDSLQLVALPYAGNEISMIVMLPRAIDGLEPLERGLTREMLTQ